MIIYRNPTFEVGRFGSTGARMTPLPAAGKGRNTRTHVLHLEAGGTLGEHEATMRQIFAVVSGEVEIATDREARRSLPPGQLVVWETGELHQSWALTDAVVVIVETDAALELPEFFEPVR